MMKIRIDFVTNSSSASFLICNTTNERKSLMDFLRENEQLLGLWNIHVQKEVRRDSKFLEDIRDIEKVIWLDEERLSFQLEDFEAVFSEYVIGPKTIAYFDASNELDDIVSVFFCCMAYYNCVSGVSKSFIYNSEE